LKSKSLLRLVPSNGAKSFSTQWDMAVAEEHIETPAL